MTLQMHTPETSQQQLKKSGKKLWLVALLSLVLLGIGGAVAYITWFRDRPSTAINPSDQNPADDKTFLKEFAAQVKFPTYYPSNPPAGFHLDTNSVSTLGGHMTFTYNRGGTSLVINEQPRPPIMETVKKIKSWTTRYGQAYTADLNGHTTGFLLTNKTLLIMSSQQNLTEQQFERLLTGLKPLG